MTRPITKFATWLAWMALPLMAQTAQTSYVLDVPASNLSQVLSQYGLTLVQALNNEDSSYLVTAPSSIPPATLIAQVTADPAVNDFEADGTVEEVEADPLSTVTPDTTSIQAMLSNISTQDYYGAPVLSSYVAQPAATQIELPAGQKAVGGNAAPIVAIIDTGVDPYHPALASSLVAGYDFTRNQAGIPSEWEDLNATSTSAFQYSSTVPLTSKTDPIILNQSTVVILDQSTVVILDGGSSTLGHFGHGTMVAGLVHLVAPQAMIMPLKAFLADGSSDTANVIRAIYYAADHGANVISMSFSSETQSAGIHAAISYAKSKGIVCVSAAGNDGEQEVVYPADQDGVVGVGSDNAMLQRSTFTNYGVDSVKMAAPGEALLTTYPGNNYAGVWGTSFGTALVSGAAALLIQANPGVDPGAVRDALESSSPLDSSLGLGDGTLDVKLAVGAVSGGDN